MPKKSNGKKGKSKSSNQIESQVARAVSRLLGPMPKRKSKRRVRGRKAQAVVQHLRGVSPQGLNFLKCAIAPVDFPGSKSGGVCDEFSGVSFVIKHRMTQSFTVTATGGLIIVVLPIPGFGSFTANSGFTLGGNPFPDYATMFGSSAAQTAQNASMFRVVGMSCELKTYSAVLSSSGRLTCARIPGLVVKPALGGANTAWQIDGLAAITEAALGASPGSYEGHVNDGVYMWSTNSDPDWEFHPIAEEGSVAINSSGGTDGSLTFAANTPFTGAGSMAGLCIRLDGSTASTSVTLMTEMCVEYLPRPGSLMASMAGPAPPHDPVALELYARAARELPACVPARENAGFWDKFLGIVSSVAGAISPFLGQFGPVAGAVSGLAGAVRSLVI